MHTSNEIVNATLANAKRMIQENMRESDLWLTRGLRAIYRRQTDDEQMAEHTKWHNGVGFGATDSGILSSFAAQLSNGRTLSRRQMEVARKCMMKYAGQLARIAREQRNPA